MLIGAMMLVFTSCFDTQFISVSNVNNATEKVKLYFTEKPTQPYQEIGLISIGTQADDSKKNLDKLRKEVLKRNGDAAMNITFLNTRSNNIISAVVIKFVQ